MKSSDTKLFLGLVYTMQFKPWYTKMFSHFIDELGQLRKQNQEGVWRKGIYGDFVLKGTNEYLIKSYQTV